MLLLVYSWKHRIVDNIQLFSTLGILQLEVCEIASTISYNNALVDLIVGTTLGYPFCVYLNNTIRF